MEEDRIYNHVADCLDVERVKHGTPLPIDLSELYESFKKKYFRSSVPDLTATFVCKFQKLPYDVAGITLLGDDALERDAIEGIRINEKLRDFPAETKVALLHEMIHATGVRGHGVELEQVLKRLWNEGAYLNPLIL